MNRLYNRIANNKGFTLLELLLVIPLIAIVLTLGYNMYFLTQRSFNTVNQSFEVTEQLRIFQMDIYRETTQAKKAETAMDALHRISSTELYIYADVDTADGKDIPELVRYYKDGTDLKRAVKITTDTDDTYPYAYDSDFGTAETVLSNVSNDDIFSAQEPVKVLEEGSDAVDYRKKLKMKLVIDSDPNDIEIESYLVSKSRTEAE